jgi:hypothetical protein
VGSLVSWRVLKKEIEEALFLVVMVLASAHLERGGREVEMVNLLGKGKRERDEGWSHWSVGHGLGRDWEKGVLSQHRHKF